MRLSTNGLIDSRSARAHYCEVSHAFSGSSAS